MFKQKALSRTKRVYEFLSVFLKMTFTISSSRNEVGYAAPMKERRHINRVSVGKLEKK